MQKIYYYFVVLLTGVIVSGCEIGAAWNVGW